MPQIGRSWENIYNRTGNAHTFNSNSRNFETARG